MPTLAIKGDNKKCKEIIKVLEMLGGENVHKLSGDETYAYYVIERNVIKCGTLIFGDEPYVFLTIENFLKQNPYSIGDRVMIPEYESEVRICKMHWDGYEVQYMVYRCDEEEYYLANELNEYNDINDLIIEDNNLYDKLDFTQEQSADKIYTSTCVKEDLYKWYPIVDEGEYWTDYDIEAYDENRLKIATIVTDGLMIYTHEECTVGWGTMAKQGDWKYMRIKID